MVTTASSSCKEGRTNRIGDKLSFGVLKHGYRLRDLLSLTSGCSEDDAEIIIISNRIKSRNDDGDNLRLLYQLEGGLFGDKTEESSAEYLKEVDSYFIQHSVDNKEHVDSRQQDDSTPALEFMDVDDFLWSQ